MNDVVIVTVDDMIPLYLDHGHHCSGVSLTMCCSGLWSQDHIITLSLTYNDNDEC